MRRETLEGLADVEARGGLVDGDEVLAWIESWGKDDEAADIARPVSLRFTERALGGSGSAEGVRCRARPGSCPNASQRSCRRVLRVLAEQPFAGRSLEDMPVRQWVAGDCVARYVVRRDGEVVVVRIWHGRGDDGRLSAARARVSAGARCPRTGQRVNTRRTAATELSRVGAGPSAYRLPPRVRPASQRVHRVSRAVRHRPRFVTVSRARLGRRPAPRRPRRAGCRTRTTSRRALSSRRSAARCCSPTGRASASARTCRRPATCVRSSSSACRSCSCATGTGRSGCSRTSAATAA